MMTKPTHDQSPAGETTPRPTYRDALRRLAAAQKSPDGQAYAVYVNRRFGRLAAAAAFVMGMTPNMVTVVSALFSFTGIAVIALVSGWAAALAAPLLAIGFALDAADGQLARLRGGGSPSGEWLDHMIDAAKVTSLHLAVLIHLFRFTDLSSGWLLVPMGYTLVIVVLFFAWLLNEQLARHRAAGLEPVTAPTVHRPIIAFAKLPLDYGLLCWMFLLLPWPRAFLTVYTFLFLANAGYLALALVKWWRMMRALDSEVA